MGFYTNKDSFFDNELEYDRYMQPVPSGKIFSHVRFKGGGKSRRGKLIVSLVGAFAGYMWAKDLFGFASNMSIGGALYGASLGGTIWSATHKPKENNTGNQYNFDIMQNQLSSKAMIPIIYGRRKWGGYQTYHKTDDDKQGLTKDIVWCEGEIDSINDVRANDIPFADCPNCSYDNHNGAANESPPSNYDKVGGYKNVAWTRTKLRVSDKLQGGNPTVTTIIKGRKVYDPRTGKTEWTDNPALCFRDYLLNKRYGTGRWVDTSMIDEDSIKECADYCDEEVLWYVPETLDKIDEVENQITYWNNYLNQHQDLSTDKVDEINKNIAALTASKNDILNNPVTQVLKSGKRYTCNLILAEEQSHINNIEQILNTFGGYMVFNGEQISLRMEKKQGVAYKFNDSNICANEHGAPDIEWSTNALSDSPNQYNVTFNDPDNEWTGVCSQWNDRADQKLRGKIISKEVTLNGVTSQSQAIRLARIFMAKNRLCPLKVTFTTGTMAMHLQCGDVITITHREVKDFPLRITAISESQGKYTLTCEQYNDSIYDDKTGTINAKLYSVIDTPYSDNIPDVTGLVATDEGNAIKLVWNSLSDYQFFRDYVIEYSLNNGSTWITAGTSITDNYKIPVSTNNATYLIRVKVENTAGRRSNGVKTSINITGAGATKGSILGLLCINVLGGFQLSWSPVNDVPNATYNVYAGKGKDLQQSECALVVQNTTSTTYKYSATLAGDYTFYVECTDGTNTYSPSLVKGLIATPDGLKENDVALSTMFAAKSDGSTSYELHADFKLPLSAVSCLVYYKVDHVDISLLGTIPEGKSMDTIGFETEWKFAGENSQMIVIPSTQVGDKYKLKFVTVDAYGNECSTEDTLYMEKVIAVKTTVPNVPQNFSFDFSDGKFSFTWNKVTNSDIDFYELRTNKRAGEKAGLLARTVSTHYTFPALSSRKDKIYLFAHNATKKYGYPATVEYNFPMPSAPTLTISATPRGMNIVSSAYPNKYCTGLVLYVSGNGFSQVYHVNSTATSIFLKPDIYTVKGAFVDIFGEGNLSEEMMFTIEPTFNPDWIRDGSMSIAKVDQTVKSALDAGNYSKDAVTTIVANLNKSPNESGYSAITQLQDAVNLRVQKGDVINQINLTPQGTTIDGKYLHVTGTTKFDNNVITDGMIKAGAVTSDKLSVNSLSAISATLGTVKGGSITGSTFGNSSGTFSIDENGNIKGAKITGSSMEISTDDLIVAGVKVKNIQLFTGTVRNGVLVNVPTGYKISQCACWVTGTTPDKPRNGDIEDYLLSCEARKTTQDDGSGWTFSIIAHYGMWIYHSEEIREYEYEEETVETGSIEYAILAVSHFGE